MACESFNDAVVEAVKALGGSKVVGVAVWPAKGVEAGQRHLLACLNPDRNEKLSPDELLHIERLARERGCHVIAEHRNAVLGYAAPVPVEPLDAAAELQRQFIEATARLSAMAERIQLLQAQAPAGGRVRAVA